MVTRENVKIARKVFNKFKYNDKLTKDELNAIENLVADYEFKYNINM